MSWSKFFPIALVLGLVSLLVPIAIVVASHGDQDNVQIRDSDDTKFSDFLSDMATITITDVPALGSDEAYEGWFISDDGSRKQSTGILTPDSEGTISQTYTSTGDNAGENLFADFDTFVVTIEPIPDPDPAPSAVAAYSHTIPAGGLAHIRHLTYSWTGNPAYESGFHEGTPKGIAVGMREQMWLAWVHAELALDSDDVDGMIQHAEHVINIIEGVDGENFGDFNGDDVAQNPGDGFGVLPYAADTIKHAEFTISAAPGDETIASHGADAIEAAENVIDLATNARDQAMLAAAAVSSPSAVELFIGSVADLTNSALNGNNDGGGAKQAYWAAQDMGAYVLGDPSDVEAPTVGDPIIPNLPQLALALGAFLLISGAYMYRRSRSRA